MFDLEYIMKVGEDRDRQDAVPAFCRPDPYDSPEYDAFVASMAKHCCCTRGVCDGVLAGGICDEIIDDEQDDWDTDEDEFLDDGYPC